MTDTEQLNAIIEQFRREERYDELLNAITIPMLQQLNVVAAKSTLSRLVITADFRFVLSDYNCEVELSPVHKALYLLFLRHEDGIEFKHLVDYRDELLGYYRLMCNRVSDDKIVTTIDRLVNPLDNAINEKCARIKAAFAQCMNSYQLKYYAISGHAQRRVDGMSRIWFERRKTISLPRNLVEIHFPLAG